MRCFRHCAAAYFCRHAISPFSAVTLSFDTLLSLRPLSEAITVHIATIDHRSPSPPERHFSLVIADMRLFSLRDAAAAITLIYAD